MFKIIFKNKILNFQNNKPTYFFLQGKIGFYKLKLLVFCFQNYLEIFIKMNVNKLRVITREKELIMTDIKVIDFCKTFSKLLEGFSSYFDLNIIQFIRFLPH